MGGRSPSPAYPWIRNEPSLLESPYHAPRPERTVGMGRRRIFASPYIPLRFHARRCFRTGGRGWRGGWRLFRHENADDELLRVEVAACRVAEGVVGDEVHEFVVLEDELRIFPKTLGRKKMGHPEAVFLQPGLIVADLLLFHFPDDFVGEAVLFDGRKEVEDCLFQLRDAVRSAAEGDGEGGLTGGESGDAAAGSDAVNAAEIFAEHLAQADTEGASERVDEVLRFA